MSERITIIDFVNKYAEKYQNDTFLREKVDGVWTETSFVKTRDESKVLAAGFMALGLAKGEKVSLIAEARPAWVITELGILFAGGVNVPLSYKLESDFFQFLVIPDFCLKLVSELIIITRFMMYLLQNIPVISRLCQIRISTTKFSFAFCDISHISDYNTSCFISPFFACSTFM